MSSKRRHKAPNLPIVAGQNPQVQTVRGAFFSGPIPPAAELERYEKIYPGISERMLQMAERQLAMAESQMKHRQGLESRVISTNAVLSYLGLVSGFILGSGGLAAAVYLIRLGRELGGAAAFIASLATLAGLFVYGRRKQEKQLEDRLKDRPAR